MSFRGGHSAHRPTLGLDSEFVKRLFDKVLLVIMTSLVIIMTFKLYLLAGKRKHSRSNVGSFLQVLHDERPGQRGDTSHPWSRGLGVNDLSCP